MRVNIRALWPLLLALTLWHTPPAETVFSMDQVGSEVSMKVGRMVGQVVEQHLAQCHLVLITTTQHSPVFTHILRQLARGSRPGVVVEVGTLPPHEYDQPAQGLLLQGLWGDFRPTCRAAILDLTNTSYTHLTLRFLEASGLWQRPETVVVVVGGRPGVEAVLLHSSLRNTLHTLYLALRDLQVLQSRRGFRPSPQQRKRGEKGCDSVKVYQRCLYCNNGKPAVLPTYMWNRDSAFLHEPLWNLMGHRLTVVVKPYFPFVQVERISDQLGTTFTPKDSVDVRIINTIATHLNYTYEMQEPLDGKWGVLQSDGNWTGIVGTLQHQQGDFSVCLWVTEERIRVQDHSRVYTLDPLTIVSLRSTKFLQYLSIIKPFTQLVWLLLLLCVVVWGVALWLLQRAWSRESNRRGMTLSTALFYGWAVLLEDSPAYSPATTSGRVLVSSWLVFCLVITTAFRSSLYAHLTSQTPPPINTLEDLVQTDGWTWGSQKMEGATYMYFYENSNPTMQVIASKMQVGGLEEQLAWVQEGGYSFISYKNYIQSVINPGSDFYISNQNFDPFGGLTWAFRKGAPFLASFNKMHQRLIEGGVINFWVADVIRRGGENREASRKFNFNEGKDGGGKEVLSLKHLQGAFYLLLLGHGLALLTLLGEHLARRRPRL